MENSNHHDHDSSIDLEFTNSMASGDDNYFSPCSQFATPVCEMVDEKWDETIEILKSQLESIRGEFEWTKWALSALRTEMGDTQLLTETNPKKCMSQDEWMEFLLDWRRKFGDWGKRVLDVSQFKHDDDRTKAGHLLMEIYRRRQALATAKAHMMKMFGIEYEHCQKKLKCVVVDGDQDQEKIDQSKGDQIKNFTETHGDHSKNVESEGDQNEEKSSNSDDDYVVVEMDFSEGVKMSIERQITISTPRNFKVVGQIVCVTAIDFEARSFVGFTEISLLPLTPQLRSVKLNCSKQCRINRVTVQETIDAAFLHDDPLSNNLNSLIQAEVTASTLASTLSSAAAKIDAERGQGELTVKFPSEIYSVVDEQRLIRIGIDYVVERPTAGINFIYPWTPSEAEKDQQLISARERGWHVYTSKSSDYHSRSWFPCVDAPGELCPWKFEITCDAAMTAICSGELVEAVYTTDLRRKTFYYVLPTPTAACHIGFAVGPFELYVHPEMNELTNFCLPHLQPLLKIGCRNLHKTFEFYEELLSSRYPYGSYKQVFVDEMPGEEEIICYCTFSILSTKVLYHQKVIEQPPSTRTLMASGIAYQFFGAFVTMASWRDLWVCRGMVKYISSLYVQRFFGHNEYTYEIYETLRQVLDYENEYGGIALLPPMADERKSDDDQYFDVRCPLTCSPAYTAMLSKKAHLIFRMLEKKLGKELLFQVLNKLLSVATHGSQQRYQPSMWSNLLLSTDSFLKCVSNVTGQDLQSFLEQWVICKGHAEFIVSFQFNRKRNMIELEIRQDLTAAGAVKYVGPVVVVVQELDGSFTHTLQIDDATSRHDIQCHSKARRQRKRKIPLWTGEEVDMDLNALDPDSPLLWIRFDPDLMTVSRIQLQQPDYQWQFQLKHEKDVLAQFSALEMLPRYPSPQTKMALVEVIEYDQCFYRVRCAACFALADVSNKLAAAWSGPPPMFTTFKRMFGSKSTPHIARLNNFSNFQQYFLMKSLVKAMALLRGPNGLCPNEVHQFLFDLLKYNNNSQNKYYDDGFRACVLEALGTTVQPGVPLTPIAMSSVFGGQRTLQLSSSQLRRIASELTLALNLERLKPSYNKIIAIACLRSLLELYKVNYFIVEPTLWWEFMAAGLYIELRKTAAECLVGYIRASKDLNTLLQLLKWLKIQPRDAWSKKPSTSDDDKNEIDSPAIRWQVARSLYATPPFKKANSARNGLNKEEAFEQFVNLLITGGLQHDLRLICLFLDSLVLMFGHSTPSFSNADAIDEPSTSAQLPSGFMMDQLNDQRVIGPGLPDVIPFGRAGQSTSTSASPMMNVFNARSMDDEEMVWENPLTMDRSTPIVPDSDH